MTATGTATTSRSDSSLRTPRVVSNHQMPAAVTASATSATPTNSTLAIRAKPTSTAAAAAAAAKATRASHRWALVAELAEPPGDTLTGRAQLRHDRWSSRSVPSSSSRILSAHSRAGSPPAWRGWTGRLPDSPAGRSLPYRLRPHHHQPGPPRYTPRWSFRAPGNRGRGVAGLGHAPRCVVVGRHPKDQGDSLLRLAMHAPQPRSLIHAPIAGRSYECPLW